MEKKKLRDISEIKKELEGPGYDFIERFAKMSDDTKSLLLRIPQEIRNHFKIKAGDKLRFYARFEETKSPKLEISLIRKNAR